MKKLSFQGTNDTAGVHRVTDMADVRSLLRNERASRRLEHPHASYSTTGSLECSVCKVPVKSDTEVWNRHLKSTQHAMRAERLRLSQGAHPVGTAPQPSPLEASNVSRKRKVSEGDDDSRKRSKAVIAPPSSFLDEDVNLAEKERVSLDSAALSSKRKASEIATQSERNTSHSDSAQELIDEAEWAAFERDVAIPPPPPKNYPPSAFMAQATISAAPVSAADLAAQEKEEERISGKERKDLELEAEREDAAKALQDEFDEMEGLEERVRRLREKREEIRLRNKNEEEIRTEVKERTGQGGGEPLGKIADYASAESEEDYSDEDWGFGR